MLSWPARLALALPLRTHPASMRFVSPILSLLLVSLGCGLQTSQPSALPGGIGERSDEPNSDEEPRWKPLDSWHDVRTSRLHLRPAGEGSPVVVFESGLGQDSSAWQAVQPMLARWTRACSYDRAGYGSSSPAVFPRDQHKMANDLRALLAEAKQPSPFVLVGHSRGGAIARWFLTDHSKDGAGLVLVEPATEDCAKRVLVTVPPSTREGFWRNLRAWGGMDAQSGIGGYESFAIQTQSLGARPLVISTAEYLAADFATRAQMHANVLRLSANHAHVLAQRSGHTIPIDAPHSVVAAVRAALLSIETGAPVAEHLPPTLVDLRQQLGP